jgi:ABC-2 type transport system ATP-binding protein
MSKIISVENLVKEYQNRFVAVRNISFSVEKGEVFALLGPNGAGKTTTLEIIEGIKSQTSGKVEVLGYDNITQTEEIKKHIGVQLQSTEYMDYVTTSEFITLFASFYKKRVDPIEMLSRVNLQDKHTSYIKQLSGGQKQCFSIALALVNDPEVLFLDEPTTGLDPHARQELWKLLENLNKSGTTIILTTHYMEEAEYLCDRVAIMEEGKILAIGSTDELINRLSKDYTLSFHVNTPINEDMFQDIEGVHSLKIEYPIVELKISDPQTFPKVIDKLNQSGTLYSYLNIKAPGLEDAYIKLTGKNIIEENK